MCKVVAQITYHNSTTYPRSLLKGRRHIIKSPTPVKRWPSSEWKTEKRASLDAGFWERGICRDRIHGLNWITVQLTSCRSKINLFFPAVK